MSIVAERETLGIDRMGRVSLCLVFLLCLLQSSWTVYAQSELEIRNKFLFRSHTSITTSNDTLTSPYRLFIPDNYDPVNHYPIVMAFHGRGEVGDDNELHIARSRLATSWADSSNQNRHPAFVVAPQAPADFNDRFYAGTNPHEHAYSLLDSLKAEFAIDEDRVYITGLSMGGDFTFMAITERPELFAAAIPMAATSNEIGRVDKLINLPIWIYHARNDNVINVGHSRGWISEFERLGLNPFFPLCDPDGKCRPLSECSRHSRVQNRRLIYTEYPVGGHSIWNASYNDPVMIDWVFSQRRGKETIGSIGSEVSLDVDVRAVLDQDPGRVIGLLGNRYPLSETEPLQLCPEVSDNVFGSTIAFPDSVDGVLEYQFAHYNESGHNLEKESIPGGMRSVFLNGSHQILPIEFWNNENGQLPNPPILIAPEVGAVLLGEVKLTWLAGQTTGRYEVEVDTSTTYLSPVASATGLRDSFIEISDLTVEKDFYWRVRAENDFGFSPWTESWSFFVLGDSPKLIAPENGSESNSETVTFQWHAFPGVVIYHIELSTMPDFSQSELHSALFESTIDLTLDNDATYYWRVRNGSLAPWSESWTFSIPTITASDGIEAPSKFQLHQNYPNPFNSTTTIRVDLPQPENVLLTVYNSIGQEVAELASGPMSAGRHHIHWNASIAPSGLYFYTILAGRFSESKSMLLMK